MRLVRSWAARSCGLILLVLAVAVVPACGGRDHWQGPEHRSGVGSGGGGGGGGPLTLFSDDFSGAFPAANWTAAALTGGGTVALDAGNGNGAPSLAMTTAARPGSGATSTLLSFAMRSVTVSVDMSAFDAFHGTGRVSVVQAAGGATVAEASWNSKTENIQFMAGAGNANVNLAADGAFHTLTFTVDAAGSASWSLDGGAAVAASAGFPAGAAAVSLGASFTNAGGNNIPTFRFDNVLVTSP